MSSNTLLRVWELVSLSTILSGVQQGSTIKWTRDGGETVHEGVLRCICTEGGLSLPSDMDVRDAYVRISAVTEVFMSIEEMVALMSDGALAIR